jgi:hypothetical protein
MKDGERGRERVVGQFWVVRDEPDGSKRFLTFKEAAIAKGVFTGQAKPPEPERSPRQNTEGF